jgi:hypothetical protein
MTERPIPFRDWEVRATLEGRKRHARRVIKPQPPAGAESVSRQLHSQDAPENDGAWTWWAGKPQTPITKPLFCPYGKPGDLLWVRETWCQGADDGRQVPLRMATLYRADGEHVTLSDGDGFTAVNKDGSEKSPWRPSIHMPRWASRITLRITDVRVERLQDVSRQDCVAEGCAGGHGSIPGYPYSATPREHFHHLWNTINGAGAWDANPWVWVVAFERVKP